MMPGKFKLIRKLWILIVLLLATLVGARWAAKELPLGSDHVFRLATWIDDRFVLICEYPTRGSGRWGATRSSRLFLYDCQDRKWIDLQSTLGIKQFDPRQPFRSPDNCFCFFDRQSRLIKLNPLNEQLPIQTWNVDSANGYVVGNRYYLSQRYCLDVVNGNGFWLPSFGSGSVSPVEGVESIVVTYHYSAADHYFEPGSAGGMSITIPDDESRNAGTDQSLPELSPQDALPQDLLQHDAVITQDFSVEFMDRPEFLHYEWYDFHIQQQAMKAGRVPTDLGLRVLYSIGEGALKQIAMWAADETLDIGPNPSRGVIVDRDATGEKIELRHGKSGQLLREMSFPFAPSKQFSICEGVLLFEGPTYRAELTMDARSGDLIALPKDIHYLIKNNDYAVCWHASAWSPRVYQLPSGEQIDDLSKLDFSSPSIAFTQDGQSLKLLMSDGDIHFRNLKTGQVQVIQPLLFREWMCWFVGGLVVVNYMVWLFWCHQNQISIQIQGAVCASFAALVGWWRLDLVPNEIVKERPAFFVLAAALIWFGFLAIGTLLSSRLPWYLKVFLAQLGYYAWYLFCFKPKSNEAEALTALLAMFGFVFCVAIVQFRMRKSEKASARFSLNKMLIATAICAVLIHQIRLVPWQPLLQVGLFYRSSILFFLVVCLTGLFANWLSKNAYQLPKTSIVVGVVGLFAVLFGRDVMSWYAMEYDVSWFGADSFQILSSLIKWLIFSGSLFCLGWNFSNRRARADSLVAAEACQACHCSHEPTG